MTVEERVVTACAAAGVDAYGTVFFGEPGAGGRLAMKDEYAVYRISRSPAEPADDAPTREICYIYLDYFAPPGANRTATRKALRKAIFSAGFTYPTETDLTSYYVKADGTPSYSYSFSCADDTALGD